MRLCVCLFLFGWFGDQSGHAQALQRFEYSQPQMGVPFRMVLYASSTNDAETAARAAFARIEQLNAVMSDYDTDSELSRLSQTAGSGRSVPVSDDLWRVLVLARSLAEETGGAFDITCGPAVSLWRKARREKRMPDPVKLTNTLRSVGSRHMRLNAEEHSVELRVPYMRLDLGAIAKGYAIDEAMKVLLSRGITSALVAGSGDMAVSEAPPGSSGWRIDIGTETNGFSGEFVRLRHGALATSGDMFQHVKIDGVRYSHIVDPRTGVGLTDQSLVVVIATNGTTADSLSTAISVLGPEKGMALARKKNVQARMTRFQDKGREQWETEDFRRSVEAVEKEKPASGLDAGR